MEDGKIEKILQQEFEQLKQYLEQYGETEEFYIKKADLLIKINEWGQALEILSNLLEKIPDLFDAWYRIGVIYLLQHHDVRSVIAFAYAAKILKQENCSKEFSELIESVCSQEDFSENAKKFFKILLADDKLLSLYTLHHLNLLEKYYFQMTDSRPVLNKCNAADGREIKLSIILPAYNAEKFIAQAIESVLQQPMTPELIIVNDGSTDKTDDICSLYSKIYTNIKYYSTPNRGAGHARNYGIQNATGDYIIFLDSDDLIFYNKINDQFQKFLQSMKQDSVDIIYTARSKADFELKGELKISFPESTDQIQAHIPNLEFWTCIYRRKFLLDNHIAFFTYPEQDVETAFRYRAFSSTDKIVVAPEYSFYLQRNNVTSNMHTYNPYVLYSIKAKVYRDLIDEAEKHDKSGVDIAYLKFVMINCIFNYVRYIQQAGWENEHTGEQIDSIEQILKACKVKFSQEAITAWGIKFYECFLEQYAYVMEHISEINHSSYKAKKSVAKPPKPAVPDIPWEILNKRLKKASEKVEWAIRQHR